MLVTAGVVAWVSGCAASERSAETPRLQYGEAGRRSERLTLAAGQESRAFEAATGALRDMGFALSRVDARAGVILTRPKWSGGLATPWIEGETTFADELDGALNTTRRVARVRIERPPEGSGEGRVTVVVDATVEHVWSPGKQVQPVSIRRTGYATEIDARTGEPRREAADTVREDPGLAAEIARRIEAAMAGG